VSVLGREVSVFTKRLSESFSAGSDLEVVAKHTAVSGSPIIIKPPEEPRPEVSESAEELILNEEEEAFSDPPPPSYVPTGPEPEGNQSGYTRQRQSHCRHPRQWRLRVT